MKIFVSYSLPQLHEAANFIWENNPYVKNWRLKPQNPHDVIEHIIESINATAKSNAKVILREKQGEQVNMEYEFINYTGTGGYYLLFSNDSDQDSDDIVINVDILVDPAVGQHAVLDTIELDNL